MTEKALDSSKEAVAVRSVRNMRRQADLAVIVGVLLYASLALVNFVYWPSAGLESLTVQNSLGVQA